MGQESDLGFWNVCHIDRSTKECARAARIPFHESLIPSLEIDFIVRRFASLQMDEMVEMHRGAVSK